jgi:carbamoyltransferase
MTAILGISAYYHDSAAALVVDGEIIAAAQEERFSRRKHDAAFPREAIRYCLEEARLSANDLDYVAFYEKPFVKFERLLESYLAFSPRGFRSFMRAMPLWMRKKLHLGREIRKELDISRRIPLIFTDHHESHAASAFFPSPFDEAAILTVDGVGEWSTATIGAGKGNKIALTRHLQFPHSLGLLYSAFTYYCGFKVNSGEYKLMGLAPYGKPVFADLILEKLLDLKADGSFRMDMSYFNYGSGLTMTNGRFDALFGGPPRRMESALLPRHFNLAASIQVVSEEILRRMAREAHRQTGSNNLVMAGGVALNCVANAKVLTDTPFANIWIQPAAGDAGGALGAALFVWYQLLDHPRHLGAQDAQKGSLLGPSFGDDAIREVVEDSGIAARHIEDEEELLEIIAALLADERVIGWFQGRMEFGPRALGSRSILADARSPAMQAKLNLKIKFRESFRPFAPIVLAEEAGRWFDLPKNAESPYMLLTAPVASAQRRVLTPEETATMESDPDLRHRVNIARSAIPAVTHVDYSARLQTIDRHRNPRLHRLLEVFRSSTGCPVLVNTSFNVRGEPIVCTPHNALQCFLATGIDVLVLGNFILEKSASQAMTAADRETYLGQFQLD